MERSIQQKNEPARRKQSGEVGEGGLSQRSSISPFPSGIQVQAKLETTEPDDELEAEADTTADLVLRKIETGSAGEVPPPPSANSRLSVSAYGGSSVTLPSRMESRLGASLGGGQSLPGSLRSQMEGAFGRSLSNVRLHTDSAAAEMSSSIGARAFTYGNDIFFNAGRYSPESAEGRHLIAHEITHTVQQSGKVSRSPDSSVRSGPSVSPGKDSDAAFVTAVTTICDYLSKISTILKDLPEAGRLAKSLDPIVVEFEKAAPTFIDYYREFNMESEILSELDSSFEAIGRVSGTTRTMDPKVIAKTAGGAIMKGASVVSWIAGCASEAKSAYEAYNISITGGVYYTFRFLCSFADHPFKAIPVPSPATKAVLMTFNISTAIGDLINIGLDKIGYNDWKLSLMQDTASRFGGQGTALGDFGAFMTGIPLYGEAFNGASRVGTAIGNGAYEYKESRDPVSDDNARMFGGKDTTLGKIAGGLAYLPNTGMVVNKAGHIGESLGDKAYEYKESRDPVSDDNARMFGGKDTTLGKVTGGLAYLPVTGKVVNKAGHIGEDIGDSVYEYKESRDPLSKENAQMYGGEDTLAGKAVGIMSYAPKVGEGINELGHLGEELGDKAYEYVESRAPLSEENAKMYGGEDTIAGKAAGALSYAPKVGEGIKYLGNKGQSWGAELAEKFPWPF